MCVSKNHQKQYAVFVKRICLRLVCKVSTHSYCANAWEWIIQVALKLYFVKDETIGICVFDNYVLSIFDDILAVFFI